MITLSVGQAGAGVAAHFHRIARAERQTGFHTEETDIVAAAAAAARPPLLLLLLLRVLARASRRQKSAGTRDCIVRSRAGYSGSTLASPREMVAASSAAAAEVAVAAPWSPRWSAWQCC